MKKSFIILVSSVLVSMVLSCQGNKNKAVVKTQDGIDSLTEGDSTVYGTMIDGGMSSLVLLTDKGDTVDYLVHPDDTTEVVKGGRINGDRFAVIAYKEYGDNYIRAAINLTTLLGNWTSLDRDFEIKEGGTVSSSLQSEKNPWSTWRIWNGKIILSKDTFSVAELGADSLALENRTGIFVYSRKENK